VAGDKKSAAGHGDIARREHPGAVVAELGVALGEVGGEQGDQTGRIRGVNTLDMDLDARVAQRISCPPVTLIA
jgi:adenylosuccinate synthase